ncbi:MAG: rhamnulokinase, partial [Erysipelotrichaceae bacterium]|nr:rhamnulokinase [Erysipelotrichaceae bacterium]
MKYALAIDIGASSGRHIVGWKENGEIRTEEVYRFPNGVKEENGHLVWNIAHLLDEVKKGIAEAKKRYDIASLSIDTWG